MSKENQMKNKKEILDFIKNHPDSKVKVAILAMHSQRMICHHETVTIMKSEPIM